MHSHIKAESHNNQVVKSEPSKVFQRADRNISQCQPIRSARAQIIEYHPTIRFQRGAEQVSADSYIVKPIANTVRWVAKDRFLHAV